MLLGGSGGLVAAILVKCPKSYYTEQFEKYGLIRDKNDTTYNTPTPYDPSLFFSLLVRHNKSWLASTKERHSPFSNPTCNTHKKGIPCASSLAPRPVTTRCTSPSPQFACGHTGASIAGNSPSLQACSSHHHLMPLHCFGGGC